MELCSWCSSLPGSPTRSGSTSGVRDSAGSWTSARRHNPEAPFSSSERYAIPQQWVKMPISDTRSRCVLKMIHQCFIKASQWLFSLKARSTRKLTPLRLRMVYVECLTEAVVVTHFSRGPSAAPQHTVCRPREFYPNILMILGMESSATCCTSRLSVYISVEVYTHSRNCCCTDPYYSSIQKVIHTIRMLQVPYPYLAKYPLQGLHSFMMLRACTRNTQSRGCLAQSRCEPFAQARHPLQRCLRTWGKSRSRFAKRESPKIA